MWPGSYLSSRGRRSGEGACANNICTVSTVAVVEAALQHTGFRVRIRMAILKSPCRTRWRASKHKFLNFRGVIFDLDPVFNNTDEWYNAIPKKIRPNKNQPFYHLFAENEEIFYIAYVSEQNLIDDLKRGPANHPDIKKIFSHFDGRSYIPHENVTN